MSHKFYITDWIPQIGRYAIITTAFKVKESRDYTGEAFVFSLDSDLFFADKRIIHKYNPEKEKLYSVDEAYMQKYALGQARNIINLQNAEVYRRKNDKNINRWKYEPTEYEAQFVFLEELREIYKDKLKELSEYTRANDLRQVILAFLSIEIRIESFDKKNSQQDT